MEPPEPGADEPVEHEERGRRIVLLLLLIVAFVFALVVLVSALAPDDKTSDDKTPDSNSAPTPRFGVARTP